MKRRISSRLTVVTKFVRPLAFCALVAWVFSPMPNFDYRFLQMLLPLFVLGTIWVLWDAISIKRVELTDDGLLVSDYFHSEIVPLESIVSVSETRWAKYASIKLNLRSQCLGRTTVRFQPSHIARLEADARLTFWQSFRWHPHPIVEDLDHMIKQTGEPTHAGDEDTRVR